MAYKIKWATGGETAERYSSKTLAHAILKERNLKRTYHKKIGWRLFDMGTAYFVSADTNANSKARLLIYLIENKLVKI